MGPRLRPLWGCVGLLLLLVSSTGLSADKYILDWDQFKRLRADQQAEYISVLRDTIIGLEKNQLSAGLKYDVSRNEIKAPFWLWEQVMAQAPEKACWVAGNESTRNPATNKCRIPVGSRCGPDNKRVTCNTFLFGIGSDNNGFCVDVNDNTTKTCDTLSIERYWVDDRPDKSKPATLEEKKKKRDLEIAKFILNHRDEKGAPNGEAIYAQQTAKIRNGGCSSVQRQQDLGLCNKLKRTVAGLDAALPGAKEELAKANKPPAVTPPGEQPAKPPVAGQPGATTPTAPPVQQAPPSARDNGRLTAHEVSKQGKSLCQFRLKGKNDYYMLRLENDGGADKVVAYHATRANDCWTKTEDVQNSHRGGILNQEDHDMKCPIQGYTFEAKSWAKDPKKFRFYVRPESYKTHVCKFMDGGNKPEVEDFIPGVNLEDERYSKKENDSKDKTMAKDLLDRAQRSVADGFKTSKAARCPDEDTRNLAYALTAVIGDKRCEVQEAQILGKNEGGEDRQKGNEIHIQSRVDNGDENGRIQFTTKDARGNLIQKTIDWKRARAGMTVADWLFNKESGLYKQLKDVGACKSIPEPAATVGVAESLGSSGQH